MVSYVCRSGPIYVLVVFVAVVAVTVVVDTGVFDVTAITDEFDVSIEAKLHGHITKNASFFG